MIPVSRTFRSLLEFPIFSICPYTSSLSGVSPDFIRGEGSQFHEKLLPDFAQYSFKSRYGIYTTQLLVQILSEAMS